MLAFKNRFHGHGSLRYVYKNGTSVRSKMLAIKYTKNPRRQTPRIAVVVSKKVLKSAVGRNRMRRRLYEILRMELAMLDPQSDIVVTVFSREVRDIDYQTLVSAVRELLTDTNLYKNS